MTSGARRNAIVTGAASGLGRAMAVRLARDGWRIAVVDIDEAGARDVAAAIDAAGGEGRTEVIDVADRDAWRALAERLRGDWSQLDLLVNNAGVCGAGQVGEFTLEHWDRLLAINLYGVIYGCHTMIDWLKENPGRAHVINTASLAAIAPLPTLGAYSVAKAGVLALSETMHAELLSSRVGVTVLCPGFIPTPLLEGAPFATEFQQKSAQAFMDRSKLSAEALAELAVQSIGRKKLYVVYGGKARWIWRAKRWFPAAFGRTVHREYQRMLAKFVEEEQ